jgi:16S rRNA (cytidine1402-2'-O)-methyltransferase
MPNPNPPHNRQNLPDPMKVYATGASQSSRISMIATPIGNLGDITERARETLERVDELWCEDTRHTQALMNALKISRGRLRRVDQHTLESDLKKMLKSVEDGGQWIGVVTDAGTPGISDPGAKISELIHEFPRIRLEAIPGASAVSAFISIAGLCSSIFEFRGFLPRNDSEILKMLESLKYGDPGKTSIFFESPNRISHAIDSLKKHSEGLDFIPKFVFAKELTKVHETIWMGEGVKFLEWLQAQAFDERGEWVFSITIPKNYVINRKDEADWLLTLECLIESGISTKDAANLISSRYSVAKKLAYQNALELQKKITK